MKKRKKKKAGYGEQSGGREEGCLADPLEKVVDDQRDGRRHPQEVDKGASENQIIIIRKGEE